MKILHINFSDTGGAAKAAMNLHFSLLGNNVDSKFLVLNLLKEYDAKDHIYSHRRIYNTFLKKLYYLYFLPVLLKFKNRKVHKANLASSEILSSPYSNFDITLDPLYKEADVIHLHWTARFLDYPTFFKKNKKPIVWTLHDKNPFSGILHCEMGFPKDYVYLENKVRSWKIKWFKNQNIIVHSPCRQYKELSLNTEVLGDFKHVVIPHFIKYFFKIENKSKIDLRRKLNLPLEDSLILVVSDDLNRELKGIKEIVSFAKQHEEFTFVFIGKSLDLIESANNIIQVGFVNRTEDLNKYYNAVDITLSNSLEESFGLSIAESLDAGTPVVVRKVGGFKDFVFEGINGSFINDVLTKDPIENALCLEVESNRLVNVSSYINIYNQVSNYVR